jgi:GxxExxY protein
MDENEIGKHVVDTAIQIHRETGPGLLETVYETILSNQLQIRGLEVKRQVSIPIEYRDLRFDEGFRADLLIENKVIVELKCVERLNNAHHKQLLTYLRLTGMHLGFLLNFSESLMKNGIHRTVNNLAE